LFAAMGATAEVTAEAGRYFVPRALGAPLFLLQSGLTAWFQGRGDTRTPMKATLVANVINVVLDPILIFGLGPIPATGIAGASWATVVGYGGSALVLARRALVLGGGARAVDRAALSAILRVGLPVGTHFVLDVAAWAVFASVLARVGEVDLAAHVLVIRIVMVSFLPGHAVGEATGVIVGQALGAGRPARARGAWLAGTRIAVALMAACGAVFTIAPGLLVGVFGPAPEVAELARRLLLVAAGFQVFDAIATVGLLTLTGAGDTRFTMVVSVLVAWAVKLPAGVGLALGAGMGVIGAWLGLTLEIFVVALLVTVRLLGGAWVAAPRETFDQSPSEPLPA
jgi:MATE family multidrug resistance protein